MTHHGRSLRLLLKDDALYHAVESDPEKAPLDDRRKALVRVAAKLTRKSSSMEEADIQQLRDVGFDDTDILHIVEVTAYFNFVNRMAHGLAVELEPWYEDAGEPREP